MCPLSFYLFFSLAVINVDKTKRGEKSNLSYFLSCDLDRTIVMTGFVKKIGTLVGMLVWQTVLAKQLVHNAIPKGVECTPEKVGD